MELFLSFTDNWDLSCTEIHAITPLKHEVRVSLLKNYLIGADLREQCFGHCQLFVVLKIIIRSCFSEGRDKYQTSFLRRLSDISLVLGLNRVGLQYFLSLNLPDKELPALHLSYYRLQSILQYFAAWNCAYLFCSFNVYFSTLSSWAFARSVDGY